MKVMVCGAQYTGCTCWCHANGTRNECGCYAEPKSSKLRPTKRVIMEGDKKDRGRDGRPLNEAVLESYLDKKVRTLGGQVIKILPGIVKGIPDRLVVMPFGRMYFVEMKTHVGEPSAAQKVWHEKSRKRGHVVHVINTKAKIDGFVRWATATGMGLKDGRRQTHKDWEALTNEYPYNEHED